MFAKKKDKLAYLYSLGNNTKNLHRLQPLYLSAKLVELTDLQCNVAGGFSMI